jgi:hypothetical protein
MLGLAGVATMATAPRPEAAAVMARLAVEVTVLQEDAEGMGPHHVVTEAPCGVDGHHLPQAIRALRGRMTEGPRPPGHTVLATGAPDGHLPGPHPLLVT